MFRSWRGTRAALAGASIALTAVILVTAPTAARAEMMAVQPDGKILLAGTGTGWWSGALVRLNPDGSVDRGFGTNGTVTIGSPAGAVAVQPDGKIVVAEARGLARFHADGSPDLDFGRSGVAAYGLKSVSSLLVLADGRIAVGGDREQESIFFHGGFVLLFSPDGRQVESQVELGFRTTLADLAQGEDGSVQVAGAGAPPSQGSPWTGLLARFVPGSKPPYDSSYGDGKGLVFFAFPESVKYGSAASALSAVPGGILVTGSGGGQARLGRFDDQGQIIGSFGRDGFASVPTGAGKASLARDVARRVDGTIVVGGETSSIEVGGPPNAACKGCWKPFVARFLPNGQLDSSFGQEGIAHLVRSGKSPLSATGETVAQGPGGSTLIAGTTTDGWNGFVVGRLLAAGTLDSGFGEGGVTTAYPCEGGRVLGTVTGCIPRAKVKIQVHHLKTGQPSLRLRVRTGAPWTVIRAIQLRLPRQLRFRARQAEKLRAVFVDSLEEKQVRRPKIGRFSLTAGPHRWDVGAMGIDIPAGTLARLRRMTPHRKLPFRITVWLAAKRHIPLKQSFVLRRSG